MATTLHSRRHQILLTLLRNLRLARKLRQSDLAHRLGQTQAVVSKVERGTRRLEVVELLEWLEALEVDVTAFVTDLESEYRRLGAGSAPRQSKLDMPNMAPLKRLLRLAAVNED